MSVFAIISEPKLITCGLDCLPDNDLMNSQVHSASFINIGLFPKFVGKHLQVSYSSNV
jgi:hypothetical protein